MGTTGGASDGVEATSTDVELIERISPYTVAADGDFTEADLTAYMAMATARFDREDPGLPSTLADYAKGLLVCHIFESSKGKRTLKGESISGYSYTKDEAKSTSYLEEYLQILASYGVEQPSVGINRTDKYVPSQFKKDQWPDVEFNQEDDSITELGD
jgi:hypothetical protein